MSDPSPIIDFHTHPVFFGEGGTRKELERLIVEARARGVRHMVALGDVLVHGESPTLSQVQSINDTTARLIGEYPDFFFGFCFLNPTLGEAATRAEIERCIDGFGFKGIKLEICNNARAACMRPVMREAEQRDVPVLQHSWNTTHLERRDRQSDPRDTAALAKRHPNTKVVMAHLSGIGRRGILHAKGIDNLWVDTSGGQPEEGLVEFAWEHLGEDRLLHGSDLPIRDPAVTIARVEAAKIPDNAKRKFLYANAARLLHLDASASL